MVYALVGQPLTSRIVFTSDGRRGTVSHVGTVDDVKGQIEHLLEGGKEAFVLRMQKYGY